MATQRIRHERIAGWVFWLAVALVVVGMGGCWPSAFGATATAEGPPSFAQVTWSSSGVASNGFYKVTFSGNNLGNSFVHINQSGVVAGAASSTGGWVSIGNSTEGNFTGSRDYPDDQKGRRIYVRFETYLNGHKNEYPAGFITLGEVMKRSYVSLRNQEKYAVTYRLMQDGVEVGRVTLQPGQALIQPVETGSDGKLEVFADVQGLSTDGIVWREVPGAVTTQKVGETTPTTDPAPAPVEMPGPNIPQTVAGTGGGSQAGAVVFKSPGDASAPVTNGVFQEGISQLAQRVAGAGGGGGGTATDMGPTNSKLDTIAGKIDQTNAKLDTANGKLGDIDGKLGEVASNTADIKKALEGDKDFSVSENVNLAQQKAQEAIEAMGGYQGLRPAAGKPTVTGLSGGDSSWGSFKVGGETLEFGMTGGIGSTDTLFGLCRPLLLIAFCVGFMRAVSGHLTAYTAALPQVVAQDSAVGPESLVPGVSQAKTWGMAAAAVAVVFGAAAALVVVVDTSLTYYGGGIASIAGAMDFPAAMTFGVIDNYVPLVPALGLTLLAASVPYLMAPVYIVAAAVLRFMRA